MELVYNPSGGIADINPTIANRFSINCVEFLYGYLDSHQDHTRKLVPRPKERYALYWPPMQSAMWLYGKLFSASKR